MYPCGSSIYFKKEGIQKKFMALICYCNSEKVPSVCTPKAFNRFDSEFKKQVGKCERKLSEKEIKKVGNFLNKNRVWFTTGTLLSDSQRDIVNQRLMHLEKALIVPPTSKPLKIHSKLQRLVSKISPRSIPIALLQKIAKGFLGPEDLDAVHIIMGMQEKRDLRILADWINNSKAPMGLLGLTNWEFEQIAPLITHLDVSKFKRLKNYSFAEREQYIAKFPNAETLVLGQLKISSIPLNLTKLKRLYIYCDYFPGGIRRDLEELHCAGSKIESIPDGFANLKKLNVSGCLNIRSLPDSLGTTLEWLDTSHCPIAGIPSTYTNLKYLKCSYNLFATLPNGMTQMETLICNFSGLTVLPEDLENLKHLNCDRCRSLECLPNCLGNLQTLNCSETQLSTLPNGLRSLKSLRYAFSKWLTLPADLQSGMKFEIC